MERNTASGTKCVEGSIETAHNSIIGLSTSIVIRSTTIQQVGLVLGLVKRVDVANQEVKNEVDTA